MTAFGLKRLHLRTDRLLLRPLRNRDAATLTAAVQQSLPELQPFLPWAESDYSVRHARDFVRRAITWRRSRVAYAFGIFDAHTRELIGGNGLHGIRSSTASAEIGYWIRSDRAGQGIATESSALVLRFAFEALRCHRVVLRAATDNVGSLRVAEKLGFHLDGVQRHEAHFARGWSDFNYFTLLEDEYRANHHLLMRWLAPKRD